VELGPIDPPIDYELGKVLSRLGQHGRAAQALERVLGARPDFYDARNRLGLAYMRLGKASLAMESWRRVLAECPDHPGANLNLAAALVDALQPEAALKYAERSVALRPEKAEAFTVLGAALTKVGRCDEGIIAHQRAVRLAPTDSRCHQSLSVALLRRGNVAEAIETLQEARQANSRDPMLHSGILVLLHYLPEVAAPQLAEEHVRWARDHASAIEQQTTWPNDLTDNRRLRVGYVSGDLCHHPVASFMTPVLMAHDRQAFEIICYSNNAFSDQTTQQLAQHADHWREVSTLGDDQLAQLIRADRIDILVDLSGHTALNRLPVFARKPAPVQATYLGYCDTTGLEAVDWLISDSVCDPPEQSPRYAERVMPLERGFSCFSPPAGAPPVGPLPCLRNRQVTLGSLNGLAKLNPALIALWCTILREMKDARLLICRQELRGVAAQRLRELFRAAGIADERVEFRCDFTPDDYLTLYHDIDIALDTFPWSGHTTACEALWMGVPVVTLAGQTHAGRMVASALTHAHLPELIARDAEEFASIVTALALDRGRLAQMRREMREHLLATPLLDARQFIGSLERGYHKMWSAFLAGNKR